MIDEDFSLKEFLSMEKEEKDGLVQQMQLYVFIALILVAVSAILLIIGIWKRELVKKISSKVFQVMVFNGIIRSY